ncbi:MAG: malate synthase G, partial [Gammaproteobacteria bacterium]|nr:malate synthase G [Gammaproteobacteria bacterium]
MTERVSAGGLQVAKLLHDFVQEQALPGTGVEAASFWDGFGRIVSELMPINRALLQKRDEIQARMDEWCTAHRGQPLDMGAYKAFLTDIGYLVPEGETFAIGTGNVDAEIGQVAGPQLVVPVNNARYALNAANARWGSLYDAFYGTDVIAEDGGLEKGLTFNARRGAAVIARAAEFLDSAVPLTDGSHADVSQYQLVRFNDHVGLSATLSGDTKTGLVDPAQFVGYREDESGLTHVLLRNNGLHIELVIDPEHPVGKL